MSSSLKDPPSFSIKPNASLLLAPIESLSSSPHSVSDIIHSCFGPQLADSKDQLSTKDTIDCTNEGALALVGEEKKPTDVYQKKLDLYMKLEHQIQQAIAKQLVEQENQLKTAQERYPNFNNPHLLQEPCPVSQFLDERVLQEEGLLVSSNYRKEPSSTHTPPHREWPAYMESTITSKLHAKVQSSLPHKKIPLKLPPVWKNSLSSEEREIAKRSLAELYRKTDFPRHLTSGFGSLKKREKTSSDSNGTKKKKKKDLLLFRAEPSQVSFTDYTPGNKYEAVLVIKNISEMSQQMSMTSPTTPYFKANLIEFPSPNEGGIIAPGMSCSYLITFSPNSLADFSDKITVMSHIGKVLSVHLIGYRPPPNLSLPMVWELGHCLVKGSTVMNLMCHNTGGEGSFKFITTSNKASENKEEDVLKVGPFTIIPTAFSLNNGESLEIKVIFEPQEVSEVSQEIVMFCDNEQETTFTLKGTGEMVNVGCVCTTNPVSSSSATIDDTLQYCTDIDDPMILFDATNPCIPVYHRAIIKNSSNVYLSYEWRFYHLRTEYTRADGSIELSPPIPYSLNSSFPFSVDPKCGTLPPGEAIPFTFCFLTEEIGCITDVMVYLELLDIPRASIDSSREGVSWIQLAQSDDTLLRIAAVCINLQGQIEPFAVNFSPPFISLPIELPPCTETRRNFTIKNHSLNDIKYEWPPMRTPHVNITIEPKSDVIVPGGVSHSELIIESTDRKGPFNIPLQCTVEHSKTPFVLPIKGKVKRPEVSVDTPCVEFGLVEFGRSACSSFQLTNHSSCIVQYELRQIIGKVVHNDDNDSLDDELLPIVDYECLDMSPSISEVMAKSSVTVTVSCSPNKECGHLRTAIECLIDGDRICILGVTAEVQRPMLILADSSLHIDTCYTSVPIKHTLTLINLTKLHTNFQWINESRTQVDLCFTPDCGPIGPHERVTVQLESTWKIKGEHTGVMAVCCARGMDYPVVLSLSAHVLGLSVSYSIETNTHNSCSSVMNFGACNQIRQPKTLTLTVDNTSAITGHLVAFVHHFPSMPLVATNNNTKSILQSTNSLAKESSKTQKKIKEELISYLLSDGRGACFTVEPSELILSPFQSQTITVTCYADMWGQYSDILTCKVYGLDAITIPIQYGVTSTPIYFQPTATYDTTQIRLGCHPAGSNPVKRTVNLTNVSSTVIRINWRSFYIDPKDDKIIDLISYIGHPFPSLTTTDTQYEEDDGYFGKLVKVHMFPHEGKPSQGVFSITPNHVVMEPHSSTSIEVTFDPSITAYNEIGEQVNGYILGYLTIEHKSSLHHVSRVQGYDMRPARMNISASITHPRLILKTRTDDNDLNFYHLVSEFFLNEQVIVNKMTKSRYFSLINRTSTNLSFHVLPMSNNKELTIATTGDDNTTLLKPSQSMEGSISVSLTHQKLLELIDEGITTTNGSYPQYVKLTDTLTVLYTTGAKQEFPLSIVLTLPNLSASPNLLDFGTCLIRRPYQGSFQLRNSLKSSPTKWTITIPRECMQIVQVDLQSGTIESTPLTITVTFTPKYEIQYSILLSISDEITSRSFTVTVTGIGSADEKYIRPRRRLK